MPTARKDIDIEGTLVEIKIEFEVWCRRCKSGICGDTEYRRGSDNNFDSFCSNCERDIDRMEAQIQELEARVEKAEALVEKLENQVEELERELKGMTADRDSWEKQASDRVDDALAFAARAEAAEAELAALRAKGGEA